MSPKSQLKIAETQAVNPRMSIGGISRTRRLTPDRIMLIGVEGVGKSTFAANAERPIFISVEDGLAEIEAEAFPEPKQFADVLAAVEQLTTEDHPYKTLVFDTLDWLEPLVWQTIIERDKVDTIEEVGGGYGKGYTVALDYFRVLLSRLEALQATKGMEVIFLAHSSIVNFQNPTGPDFSRYEPKMNKKAAALFKEWSKAVLFATYEQHVADAQKGDIVTGISSKKRVKGFATGERIIHTTRSAAWDAKNRISLPKTLPLSYEAYAEARAEGQKSGVYAECVDIIRDLGLDPSHAARGFVEANKANPTELVKALARLKKLQSETVAQ